MVSSGLIIALFAALLAQCTLVNALYSPKGDVIIAGADNFKEEVLQSKGVVIVEFFAPWCGHCKSLTPEYEKAAKVLKGVAKVVAVDATAHESLAAKYQVKGFPTLKIFGADKKAPVDYNGQRTADDIITNVMKATNQLVKDRKSGKAKASSSSSDDGAAKKPKSKSKKSGSKDAVIELNSHNFNALVLESKDHWLVEFYAPWCGHCKKLAPEWAEAADQLKAQGIKLGALDATASEDLAQKYQIRGFPTIKLFPAGAKSEHTVPEDYAGAREAAAIVDYAINTFDTASAGQPVALRQITGPSSYEDICGAAKLCAILFVPHILDSGADGRNSYLQTFGEVAKDFRKMPFAFAWSEGTAQAGLEQALSINGNFPTVAVLSHTKKVVAVPKVSWSKKNILSFVSGVLSGIEKTTPFAGEPSVVEVAPWDGKDGALNVEEMSLDDLFADE